MSTVTGPFLAVAVARGEDGMRKTRPGEGGPGSRGGGGGGGKKRGRDAEDPAWGGGRGQSAAGEGGVVLADGDGGGADVVAWPGQQPAARRGDCGVDSSGADPEQVVSG